MFKRIGYHRGLVAHGLLPKHTAKEASYIAQVAIAIQKEQQAKTAAADPTSGTPTSKEMSAAGAAITPQDLKSFEKILSMLYGMYHEYQMQGGGGGPGAAMISQAQAAGIMQAGGGDPAMAGSAMPPGPMPPGPMPPGPMPGGMIGMPPQQMPPQTPGGMPPGGM